MKNTQKLSFKLTSHGVAIHPPGATFGPRNMLEYEFVWIIEGDVEFECDGVFYPAPAGTITLVHPGVSDAYKWDKKRQTRQPFFHFAMKRNGAVFPKEKDWPRVRQMPEGDIMRSLFRNLLWLADSDIKDSAEIIGGIIRQMLVAFVSGTEETRALGQVEFPLAVERALSYVQSLWKEGKMTVPTLEELALESHVSSVHLCRLFEKEFGLAPMKAIRLLRLDRAALLLAKTNLSIQEVSELAGFKNQFHFSRCFKEVYSSSPRSFRKGTEKGMRTPISHLTQVKKMRRVILNEKLL